MLQPDLQPRCLLGLCLIALTHLTGCPVVSNLSAPGRVLTLTEPGTQRTYHLYVPTHYHDDTAVALVVTCHGTRPWDTARSQLKEWKGLAEQKNFLVAAPELVGTKGDLPPKPEAQIRRQQEDERAILAMIRMIRGARNVNEHRIFLTGWSAGSYAVLFTGLRHPEIFRALAVRQGNFDPAYFEPCVPFLDRYQPIQVMFGDLDPIDNSQPIVDWLNGHELRPTTLERPGIHRRDPAPVYAFFADVVRKRPRVSVRVQEDPRDPMRIRFGLRTSLEPARVLWDFGDSQRAPEAAPQHRYAQPGLYTVKVAVWPAKGGPYVRQISLQVPGIRLGVASPGPTPP